MEGCYVVDITNSLIERAVLMVKCDSRHGKCITYCMVYRGEVIPKDVNASVALMKTRTKFFFHPQQHLCDSMVR